MMARALALAAALVLATAAACGGMVAKEQGAVQMYSWWPSESAPKDAPIFFVRGDLALGDGTGTYVPDQRVANKGWGVVGSTHIVDQKAKALPRQAALTWFSYVEDRFYSGQFALPTDRMAELFDRGAPLPPPRGRQAYDRIIFGMAPGGGVSVWMSAGPVVTEVATFRAAPAEVPWTEVVDNPEVSRADHVARVLESTIGADGLERLRAEPGRLALWSDYARRIAWVPQLAGAAPQGAILWFKGLNGENDWIDLADPTRGGEPLPQALPLPASLVLTWRMADGARRAEIALDPVETVAAFKKLAGADRPGPLTLMLEASPTGETVDLFLRRGDLAYRFTNTTVEVFGGD